MRTSKRKKRRKKKAREETNTCAHARITVKHIYHIIVSMSRTYQYYHTCPVVQYYRSAHDPPRLRGGTYVTAKSRTQVSYNATTRCIKNHLFFHLNELESQHHVPVPEQPPVRQPGQPRQAQQKVKNYRRVVRPRVLVADQQSVAQPPPLGPRLPQPPIHLHVPRERVHRVEQRRQQDEPP